AWPAVPFQPSAFSALSAAAQSSVGSTASPYQQHHMARVDRVRPGISSGGRKETAPPKRGRRASYRLADSDCLAAGLRSVRELRARSEDSADDARAMAGPLERPPRRPWCAGTRADDQPVVEPQGPLTKCSLAQELGAPRTNAALISL